MRTEPAPGSDPLPGRSSFERGDDADQPNPGGNGNDARLSTDVPPHY